MRWMDKPPASAASMCSFQGSHRLSGPVPPDDSWEPVRGLTGDFESSSAPQPVCGVGEFKLGASEPVRGSVGDFGPAAAKYRRTVSLSTPSSRAILRLDQPCSNRATIVCC